MDAKEIAVMMVLLAALATVGWCMNLAADSVKWQRRLKAQTELHSRLLEKFSSANEVVEFLQTPGGTKFVDSISNNREEPAGGILRSTHRGIILVIVALGCLGLIVPFGWRENPLLVIGVILLCLGIGFLVSAAVSQLLSKTLGLAGRSGNNQ
jgi:hypothetical protein